MATFVFAARRIGAAVLMLAALTFLVFTLIRLTPGNSATTVAVRQAGSGATQEQIDRIRAELGLDDPIAVQYVGWLGDAVTGDFGVSERTGRTISTELTSRYPETLFLAAGGAGLALLVGVGAGVVSAIVRPGVTRTGLRIGALTGASVPSFWLSYLLIVLFSERLGWLPTSGNRGLASWIMPWVVLATPAAAIISRVIAVSLREAMTRPYATAAAARGASRRSIVARDALPNAAGASLNVVGLQLGGLLAGSVVVETVFAWPGLGAYFVDSVTFRDDDAILACVMVFAVGFVVVNQLVDVVQRRVDPRLRHRATPRS